MAPPPSLRCSGVNPAHLTTLRSSGKPGPAFSFSLPTPSPHTETAAPFRGSGCQAAYHSQAFLMGCLSFHLVRSTTKPVAKSPYPSMSPRTRTKSMNWFSRVSWVSGCYRGEASRRPSSPHAPPSSTSWCRSDCRPAAAPPLGLGRRNESGARAQGKAQCLECLPLHSDRLASAGRLHSVIRCWGEGG